MVLDRRRLEDILKPIITVLISQRNMVLVETIVCQAGIRGALRGAGGCYIIGQNRRWPTPILWIAGSKTVIKSLRPFGYPCLGRCRQIPAFAQWPLSAIISVIRDFHRARSSFRSNDNDPVGSTHPINGGRTGIL